MPSGNLLSVRIARLSLLPLLVFALPASAQEQADDPAERALSLFEESVGLYQEGRFEEAIVLLRRAYATHEEPVLLYNLGRALEGNGEYAEAVDAYERYLDTSGEIPDRGAIERKVVTLRANLADRARLGRMDEVTDEQSRPATQPTDSGGGGSPVPWIVAGGGALIVGVGAVLGVLADGAHDDALSAPSQEATREEQDRAEGLALGANLAFVVGGLVAAGGIVWGVLELGSSDEQQTRVSVGPTGIAVEGVF